MRYLPHTQNEIDEMLKAIGMPSIDSLFEAIPASHRFQGPLALEPSLDEASLMKHLRALAKKNEASSMLSFMGGGIYDHHIPPAVDQLLMRSEFYTAYTPYQPELSQGTLQAIFEFQSIVCELYKMEVANASMYDGASAAAEAVLMARRIRNQTHAVVSGALHPHYIDTIRAYLKGTDGEPDITIIPTDESGRTDVESLRAHVRDDTACIVIGYPNFFGVVDRLDEASIIAKEKGALLVSVTMEPYALALLKPPGAFDVDIAVGEGQALAVPPQFGGPGVGLFTCKSKYIRQMPGRLCGETVDSNGQRGFVLTLSTREQHIRREKATSNICTNHGLIALSMLIRTAMLGKVGFEKAAQLCLNHTTYLKNQLLETGTVSLPYSGLTMNEMVIRLNHGTAADHLKKLEKEGILGGIDLGLFTEDKKSDILIAVTEKHTREEIDHFVAVWKKVARS